jgi:hypothetical protein
MAKPKDQKNQSKLQRLKKVYKVLTENCLKIIKNSKKTTYFKGNSKNIIN